MFLLRVMVIFAVFAPQSIAAGFARSVASETFPHMVKFNLVLGMCADLLFDFFTWNRHDAARFGDVVVVGRGNPQCS